MDLFNYRNVIASFMGKITKTFFLDTSSPTSIQISSAWLFLHSLYGGLLLYQSILCNVSMQTMEADFRVMQSKAPFCVFHTVRWGMTPVCIDPFWKRQDRDRSHATLPTSLELWLELKHSWHYQIRSHNYEKGIF